MCLSIMDSEDSMQQWIQLFDHGMISDRLSFTLEKTGKWSRDYNYAQLTNELFAKTTNESKN